MVTIEQIKASAVNPAAVKNAEGIVRKKKYKTLSKSSDESYLYGVFTGSGASDYTVYVDTIDGIKSKCSCPSRQIPCKHALALMLLGVEGSITEEIEIPEEVLGKREKREKTKEKAKEKLESGVLSKADINKVKLLKKGIEYLEISLDYIMKNGIKKYMKDSSEEIEKIYKALGDHKLTGTQGVFFKFKEALEKGNEEEAIDNLILLNTLVKKGKLDIEERLNSNKLEVNKESNLESLIATTRKVEELEAIGLFKEDRKLMQLTLFIKDINTQGESYNAVYIDIEDGNIYTTKNYTNFGLSNSSEDTMLKAINIKRFFIYPGKKYNKIKLGDYQEINLDIKILKEILNYSKDNYEEAIKEAKSYFNNPLIWDEGYIILNYSKVLSLGDRVWIANKRDEELELENSKELKIISEDYKEGAILVKVEKNLTKGNLVYNGMALISEKGILYLI